MSDSLRPHESQHARPPCPSPTPGVHSNSCPSSWWSIPAISSSLVPFSSCSQSLPASETFPMSQLFAWGGQSIRVPALASILRHSAFFVVQLSHPYMTTGKTVALTRRTFVGKIVFSNSCPYSQWCYLTISSSATCFSFCLQSFPASGSFPMSRLFTSGGQSIGAFYL